MNHRARELLKRSLDVAVSAVATLLLCPLIAVIVVSVRASLGGPVLFRQARAGYKGKPFTVFKFRTMRDLVDPAGRPLPDKERITPLGRALRKTSLDELPQLVNVLKGDMSLVGPRPLRIEYLKLYTAQQARRHDVKPGITGLVQINGRNTLSWDERFALDVWYVDHASLFLDLRILLQTVVSVLRRDGISAEGDLDVPSFTGSPSVTHPQTELPNLPNRSSQ